jgi:propionyl-CoA synthetase
MSIHQPDVIEEFYRQSVCEPERFWDREAQRIHWDCGFDQVCDFSRPPFVRWFVGGHTNLCYNAVDRHLATRAHQVAIYHLSSETGEQRTLTFEDLHREVNVLAAGLRALGLQRGDRVVIYLPMIPEAAIAMLACARLGLVHSVVFAGFAAPSLASRIDDAGAKAVITADAGLRGGKLVPLKKLVDEALELAATVVNHVIVVQRGIDSSIVMQAGRDRDYLALCAPHAGAEVPCEWLESSEPSYLLYTSGTTARPKGIQRDTGGYAVALAASMQHIYAGRPGETYFSTADVGWVVGHSYTVYGPLIHGMATVIYEGLPICPDGGIWWKIAQDTGATVMFSSPTALRTLKKHDPSFITRHDLSRLRYLFLAGEPLDEPTARWICDALGHVQIIDNYWQTETGWPILTLMPGVGPVQVKFGSPGKPAFGYDVRVVDPQSGEPLARGQKGVLAAALPLPPGCMSTIWQNDSMFPDHYCGQFPGKYFYSTFDYAVQDEDGYFFVLGRTDDVINVSGHRLGTREIEEAICSHPAVAEAAAVGVACETKGQVVHCFAVLKQPERYESEEERASITNEIEAAVVKTMGAFARPAFVGIVKALPKTRSGKIVRRAILAVVENRDSGDISTMEDAAALDEIRRCETLKSNIMDNQTQAGQSSNNQSPGARLRAAVEAECPLQVVGAVNAFCALLAERAGFRALYLSGAGVANASFGLPDLGLTTLSEVCEDVRRITQASALPLLVDADTGWGGAFMIGRTIRELSRAGAAGCHLEDQVQAKRCGHRPGKALVSTQEMCDRLKAACDARSDHSFVIMARTDAHAVEGLEAAIARAQAYVAAGADMIFAEALTSVAEYSAFTTALGPQTCVLANMTEFGKTPLLSVDELGGAGVRLVLYPLSAFRAMNRAAQNVYETVRREGTQQELLGTMQTRAELYEVLGYHAYEEKLDELFAQAQGKDNE